MISIRKIKSNYTTKDKWFVCLWILFTTINPSASAANGSGSNSSFNYMGRLTQSNGAPLIGPVDLQINFYNTLTDGTPLGSSPYFFAAVTLDEGGFQIQITLSGTDINAIFPDTNAETFIEVTNATDRKTYPRQRFSLVPYALKVPVDGKTLAFDSNGQLAVKDLAIDKITGLVEALAGKAAMNQQLGGDITGSFGATTLTKLRGQEVSTTAPNSGEVLTFVDGKWTPQSLGSLAVGTVTGISAEAPLATTGPARSPKLILAQANGVASGYLANSDWLTFNSKQDSLGYTPLNQSGGTMTGTINMGGKRLTNLPAPVAATDAVTKLYADATLLHRDGSVPLNGPWAVGDDLTNVGNINLSTQKTLGLGTYDADAEAILMASLKEDDQGKTWFSSNSSEIKFWDGYSAKAIGVSGSSLSSFNAQTGNTQTLAVPGTSGTAPAWSSASNAHTLNIPLASAASVTAGLISNSDYNTFNGKVGGVTSGTGVTVSTTGNIATVNLATAGTAGNYSKVTTDAYGRVTSGTSLSAADIPQLSAATITSGTLTVANGGTGATTLAANNVLLGNGTSAPLTVAPGASGNVLMSDGTTWASSTPTTNWAAPGTIGATTPSSAAFTSLTASGNVGIGTTSPGAKLAVAGGQAIGTFVSSSNTTIDWNAGNIQSTDAATGTITFTAGSMLDGGAYTLALTNATGGNYSFASTGLTFKCNPACPITVTAGRHTVASMIKAGAIVYVSWVKGFQ